MVLRAVYPAKCLKAANLPKSRYELIDSFKIIIDFPRT